MADTHARKRNVLLWVAIVAVVVVCAILAVFAAQRALGGAVRQPGAADTLGVFITDQLEGFREPYT